LSNAAPGLLELAVFLPRAINRILQFNSNGDFTHSSSLPANQYGVKAGAPDETGIAFPKRHSFEHEDRKGRKELTPRNVFAFFAISCSQLACF